MEAIEKETRARIAGIGFKNRRYPRFDIHLPLEYCQFKSSFAHTGNISENGLLAYFSEEMDLSQYLRLKLFFPTGPELNAINLLAEVVWMDYHLNENQKYYPYGLKFVEILPEDVTRLREFLESLSSPIKVRFWTRKLLRNLPEGILQGRRALGIFSLVSKFE